MHDQPISRSSSVSAIPTSTGTPPADKHLQLDQSEDGRWRERIDAEIDLSIMMGRLAAQYEDDFRSLLALYALTTSVRIADLSGLLGLHPKNFAATVGNRVRDDLERLV